MKLLSILALLMLCGIYCKAQSAPVPAIVYSYDNNGSRIQRKFMTITPDQGGGGGAGNERKTVKDTIPAIDPKTIKVFPNPTDGIVNINFTGYDKLKLNFEIVDMNGKPVINKNSVDMNNTLDLTPFAAGLYELTVRLNDRVSRYKIIYNK